MGLEKIKKIMCAACIYYQGDEEADVDEDTGVPIFGTCHLNPPQRVRPFPTTDELQRRLDSWALPVTWSDSWCSMGVHNGSKD